MIDGRRIVTAPVPYSRFFSIASQIFAATSGPPSRAMARMPVGDVTLISVSLPSITSMPTNKAWNPFKKRPQKRCA